MGDEISVIGSKVLCTVPVCPFYGLQKNNECLRGLQENNVFLQGTALIICTYPTVLRKPQDECTSNPVQKSGFHEKRSKVLVRLRNGSAGI